MAELKAAAGLLLDSSVDAVAELLIAASQGSPSMGVPPSPLRTERKSNFSVDVSTPVQLVDQAEAAVSSNTPDEADPDLRDTTSDATDSSAALPLEAATEGVRQRRPTSREIESSASEGRPTKRARKAESQTTGAVRRPNVVWTPERHAAFLVALRVCQAREPDMVITATMIHKELSKPEYGGTDLTGPQIQSHLQRFRNGAFKDDDHQVTERVIASLAKVEQLTLSNCKVCDNAGDDDLLLLCDFCDQGFHTYCLEPPLTHVPSGDWYCSECDKKSPEEKASRSERRFQNVIIIPPRSKTFKTSQATLPRKRNRAQKRSSAYETSAASGGAAGLRYSDDSFVQSSSRYQASKASHVCTGDCVEIDGHIFHCSDQDGDYGPINFDGKPTAFLASRASASASDSALLSNPERRAAQITSSAVTNPWLIGSADLEQLLSPYARCRNVRDALLQLFSRQSRSRLSLSDRADFLVFLRQLIAREQFSVWQDDIENAHAEHVQGLGIKIDLPPAILEAMISEHTAGVSRGQAIIASAEQWAASHNNPKDHFVFPTFSSSSLLDQDVAAGQLMAPTFLSVRDRAAITPKLGEFWLKWLAASELSQATESEPRFEPCNTYVFPLASENATLSASSAALDPVSLAFFAQGIRVSPSSLLATNESSPSWKLAFGNARHLVFPYDKNGRLLSIVLRQSAEGSEFIVIAPFGEDHTGAVEKIAAFLQMATLSRTAFAHAQSLLEVPADLATRVKFEFSVERRDVDRGRTEVESNLNVLASTEAVLFGTQGLDVRRRIAVAVDAVLVNNPTCIDSLMSVVRRWQAVVEKNAAFKLFILQHHVSIPERYQALLTSVSDNVLSVQWEQSLRSADRLFDADTSSFYPPCAPSDIDAYVTDSESDTADQGAIQVVTKRQHASHDVSSDEHMRATGDIDTAVKKSKKSKWSEAENAALYNLVREQLVREQAETDSANTDTGAKWTEIAEKIRELVPASTKDAGQCAQHWTRVLDPSIVKGPWLLAEEVFLMRLVEVAVEGQREWRKISRALVARTNQQCRSHFLRIEETSKPESWNPSMDSALRAAVGREHAFWQAQAHVGDARPELIRWEEVAKTLQKHMRSTQPFPAYSCWLRFCALDLKGALLPGVNVDQAFPAGLEAERVKDARQLARSQLRANDAAEGSRSL